MSAFCCCCLFFYICFGFYFIFLWVFSWVFLLLLLLLLFCLFAWLVSNEKWTFYNSEHVTTFYTQKSERQSDSQCSGSSEVRSHWNERIIHCDGPSLSPSFREDRTTSGWYSPGVCDQIMIGRRSVSVYEYIYIYIHSSGAVWESRWPSWAVRPNEPSGFRGRKALLNHASALVSACP